VRQKNLSLGKIREILIPFPPIIEQHRVADQIEKVAVETQRLASIYHRKLAALDELKKSLLHRAFTGQL
jgi:type I restriction enzyme S subunit